jgi:hypothetical protein
MTTKQPDQSQDKELLERYRRASDAEASAPSDTVRAAILAEGRRVAGELKKKDSQPPFDTKRPAANDSRWKITAFGTMGAALLAALLIAPRYWETRPAINSSTAPAVALALPQPDSARSAGAPPTASLQMAPATPELQSVAPKASSDALQEVVVTQANRRRSNAKSEIAQTPAAPPKDTDLSNGPVALAAPAPNTPPVVTNKIVENFASSKSAASPYERLNDARLVGGAARSADSASAPLQSAAQSGDVAETTALLDKGASIDSRDAQGRTPLMVAIAQGRLDVVRLLLQRGANPNLADNAGKTPLQQATDRNLQDIAALLRDSGAR